MLSPVGQESIVRCGAIVAAADDQLSDAEMELLVRVGQCLGMTAAHVRGVLSELAATS